MIEEHNSVFPVPGRPVIHMLAEVSDSTQSRNMLDLRNHSPVKGARKPKACSRLPCAPSDGKGHIQERTERFSSPLIWACVLSTRKLISLISDSEYASIRRK